MSKTRASDAVLGELHLKVAMLLLEKIENGTATPAEINAAIKFLQNNDIQAIAEQGDALDKLYRALPEFDDEAEYAN